jgi:hypothetical protein
VVWVGSGVTAGGSVPRGPAVQISGVRRTDESGESEALDSATGPAVVDEPGLAPGLDAGPLTAAASTAAVKTAPTVTNARRFHNSAANF